MSTISTLLETINGSQLGKEALVCRLLKGMDAIEKIDCTRLNGQGTTCLINGSMLLSLMKPLFG